MCTHPHLIWNKSISSWQEVPCRVCIECRLNYTKEWAVRIVNEASLYNNNCFLTLTYNDVNLPTDNNVHKRDLQLFVKRLRKHLPTTKIRYFGCGEYGGKFGRPHYHIIIFNWYPSDSYFDKSCDKMRSPTLEKLWPFGFTSVGDVNFNSARYVASYIVKQHRGKQKSYYKDNGINPEFVIMSNGLGKVFCLKNELQIKGLGFVPFNGQKVKTPRYYENLIYTTDIDKERRKNEKLSYLEKFKKIFEANLKFSDYLRTSCSYREKTGYTLKERDWIEYQRLSSRADREQRLKNKIERKFK